MATATASRPSPSRRRRAGVATKTRCSSRRADRRRRRAGLARRRKGRSEQPYGRLFLCFASDKHAAFGWCTGAMVLEEKHWGGRTVSRVAFWADTLPTVCATWRLLRIHLVTSDRQTRTICAVPRRRFPGVSPLLHLTTILPRPYSRQLLARRSCIHTCNCDYIEA